jgi:chemotaxis protein MotB
VLFDSGGATLLPGGRRILDTVSPTLIKLPNRLSIDGHTNSIPIATAQFPSNWELSTARATGVLRYLHSSHGIPYSRMSATGFADTRPLFPASNPKALALNRRVEIVVLARLDGSAGRAVAALGNKAPIDATSSTSSVSATASASPSASPTALPKPAHNLLGPDPTPSASASRRTTKTTRTRTRATVTTAPGSG